MIAYVEVSANHGEPMFLLAVCIFIFTGCFKINIGIFLLFCCTHPFKTHMIIHMIIRRFSVFYVGWIIFCCLCLSMFLFYITGNIFSRKKSCENKKSRESRKALPQRVDKVLSTRCQTMKNVRQPLILTCSVKIVNHPDRRTNGKDAV